MGTSVAAASLFSAGSASAGASSGALGFLGTIIGLTGVGSTLMAGREAEYANTLEARQQEQEAQREKLAGAQRETARLRALRSALASQSAIFGSRGISISSGTPTVLAKESKAAAEREQLTDDLNTSFRVGQSLSGAAQSKQAGAAARKQAIAKAGQSLLGFAKGSVGRGGA